MKAIYTIRPILFLCSTSFHPDHDHHHPLLHHHHCTEASQMKNFEIRTLQVASKMAGHKGKGHRQPSPNLFLYSKKAP